MTSSPGFKLGDIEMDRLSLSFVDCCVNYANMRLADFHWREDAREGSAQDPRWTFTVPGTATKADKAELKRYFLAHEWAHVELRNSGETPGEQPGTFTFTLYKNSPV